MNEISQIISPGEKVAYDGKPKYAPYILMPIFGAVMAAAFFGIVIAVTTKSVILGVAIGVIVLLLGIIFTNMAYTRTHYSITDKRVIIQSGIIGRDFKSVDYNKMQNVSASVGLLGVIFKVGTIKIFTGEMQTVGGRHPRLQPKYDKLSYVAKPYDLLKEIQTHLVRR